MSPTTARRNSRRHTSAHSNSTPPPAPAPTPHGKGMTKTEAYALVKKAREGLRDADFQIWKGTAEQVKASLLATVGATTRLLDALGHEGINGVE